MGALDEFSAIIWPDEIRRFNRNTQARFKGVGIQIELDPMSNIKVVTPLEGTPAQRAGIRPGDLIKKVDGKSTEGFSLDQAVDVITGPGDTKVTLTIEREVAEDTGDKKIVEFEFPLVRKENPGHHRQGLEEIRSQGRRVGLVRRSSGQDRLRPAHAVRRED
jgi:C-terminal processing protease CtpA/Prc